MKLKVITVSKKFQLLDAIKQIADYSEENFCMVYIEKSLIDTRKLKEYKFSTTEDVFELEEDGYRLILDYGPNSNNPWLVLWSVYTSENNMFFSPMNNIMDYLNNKCDEVEVWIRKWGSKAEIKASGE